MKKFNNLANTNKDAEAAKEEMLMGMIEEIFDGPTEEEIIEIEQEIEDTIDEAEDFYSEESIKMYLNEIGRIRLLTLEEEQALGKIIAEGGEGALEARNKLVEANLRLAMYNAKKFGNSMMSIEEVNSMAVEGLIRAAQKYDYTKGFKFSTYATWWIRQSITRGIADEANLVRIPVHMNETIQKVLRAKKLLSQDGITEPSIKEIVEYTGIEESRVEQAFEAMYSIVSFDKNVGEDDDTTLGDLLKDVNADDPCDVVIKENLRNDIREALNVLTPKEIMVIKCRFGLDLDGGMTLDEIAKLENFGVSRERIRQIESKALRKLKRSHTVYSLLKEYAS